MLTLKDVRWKPEDGEAVLKGIDLQVQTGKLTVVTGPNGGGKTSLAKVIAGLNQITRGSMLLDGTDITDMDITERARFGISYAFQQPVRFKGVTVRDLLELAAGGQMREDRICEILAKVGLCTKDYIDREVNASLSGGEIKRIEIASVLARQNSRLLIFDEPEAGIDLWSFTNLIEVFQRLKNKEGEALLVISHQERILEIADRVVVVDSGRIRLAGDRSEILPRLLAQEKAARCPREEERSCAR